MKGQPPAVGSRPPLRSRMVRAIASVSSGLFRFCRGQPPRNSVDASRGEAVGAEDEADDVFTRSDGAEDCDSCSTRGGGSIEDADDELERDAGSTSPEAAGVLGGGRRRTPAGAQPGGRSGPKTGFWFSSRMMFSWAGKLQKHRNNGEKTSTKNRGGE